MSQATDVPPRPAPTARYALTGLLLLACGAMLWPFLPGAATGVAAAAVCLPLHRGVLRWTGGRDALAAVLTTTLVVLVVGVALGLLTLQLAVETRQGVEVAKEKATDGTARHLLEGVPYAGEYLHKVETGEVSLEAEARSVLGRLGSTTLGLAQGLAAAAFQLVLAAFVLYYTLKDHAHLKAAAERLLPVPRPAADRLMRRMDDAIRGTVNGTLLAGVVQGVTGGLLFWLLGLPAPVLWGTVMGVLGVVPLLGAVLVWAPAAVWLAANQQWGTAAALVAWGVVMAGPVGNYLYAVTAGDRLRLHPVPVLLAYLGGLVVFGAAGMVIGPVVLALTVGLLEEQGVETE